MSDGFADIDVWCDELGKLGEVCNLRRRKLAT